MKGLNDIVDKAIDLIKSIDRYPLDAVTVFRATLMDMPLANPTATVGIRSVNMKSDTLSTYMGQRDGAAQYSMPAEIVLSADIYLPSTANGFALYDAFTYLADAFMKSDFTVSSINCEDTRYDSTFMCTVLPVSISLNDRLCGNTVGGYPV